MSREFLRRLEKVSHGIVFSIRILCCEYVIERSVAFPHCLYIHIYTHFMFIRLFQFDFVLTFHFTVKRALHKAEIDRFVTETFTLKLFRTVKLFADFEQ